MVAKATAPAEGHTGSQQGKGTGHSRGLLLTDGLQLHGDQSVKPISIGDTRKIKTIFNRNATRVTENIGASKERLRRRVSVKDIKITCEFSRSAIA